MSAPVVLEHKPCRRYDPHPAHRHEIHGGGTWTGFVIDCAGLAEMQPHGFDARMGYDEYIRCCHLPAFHPLHVGRVAS